MEEVPERFVALDVHKNYVVAAAVDGRQELVLKARRIRMEDLGSSRSGTVAGIPYGKRVSIGSKKPPLYRFVTSEFYLRGDSCIVSDGEVSWGQCSPDSANNSAPPGCSENWQNGGILHRPSTR